MPRAEGVELLAASLDRPAARGELVGEEPAELRDRVARLPGVLLEPVAQGTLAAGNAASRASMFSRAASSLVSIRSSTERMS